MHLVLAKLLADPVSRTQVVNAIVELVMKYNYDGIDLDFEGLENYIESSYEEAATASIKRWAASFMDSYNCVSCEGSRLKKKPSILN